MEDGEVLMEWAEHVGTKGISGKETKVKQITWGRTEATAKRWAGVI